MPEQVMEITISGKNDFTSTSTQVKSELSGISVEAEKVGLKAKEATKTINQSFKESRKELIDFRKTITLAAIAIGAMVAVTREASKYSDEAQTSYSGFAGSARELSVVIGSELAPSLEGLTFTLQSLSDLIELSSAGFQKIGLFLGGFFGNYQQGMTATQSATLAWAEANEEVERSMVKIEEARMRAVSNTPIDMKISVTKDKKNLKGDNKEDDKELESWKNKTLAITSYGEALGSIGDIMKAYSGESKRMAKAAAAVAIASAIVTGGMVVLNAFATQPWIPVGLAAGIAATAMVAAQIAVMSSQSFHKGGLVLHNGGLASNEVSATLLTGEGVVNRSGMANLGASGLDRLNNGRSFGQTVNISINYPQFRSDDDIDQLTEQISRKLAFESERL
jgi:hypothetical protein